MAPLCPCRPHHTRGVRWNEAHRLCTSPSNCPWTRPATRPGTGRGYSFSYLKCRMNFGVLNNPGCNSLWWGPDWSRAAPGRGRPFTAHYSLNDLRCRFPFVRHFDLPHLFTAQLYRKSVRFFANFFTRPLASQRGLHAFLFPGFQVKGVALYFFNNVFLLHLALKTAQGVFEGLTLLQSNFRQVNTPPNPSGRTLPILQEFKCKSRRGYGKNVPYPEEVTLTNFVGGIDDELNLSTLRNFTPPR